MHRPHTRIGCSNAASGLQCGTHIRYPRKARYGRFGMRVLHEVLSLLVAVPLHPFELQTSAIASKIPRVSGSKQCVKIIEPRNGSLFSVPVRYKSTYTH